MVRILTQSDFPGAEQSISDKIVMLRKNRVGRPGQRQHGHLFMRISYEISVGVRLNAAHSAVQGNLISNCSRMSSPASLASRRHPVATPFGSCDAPATGLKGVVYVSHTATKSKQNLRGNLPKLKYHQVVLKEYHFYREITYSAELVLIRVTSNFLEVSCICLQTGRSRVRIWRGKMEIDLPEVWNHWLLCNAGCLCRDLHYMLLSWKKHTARILKRISNTWAVPIASSPTDKPIHNRHRTGCSEDSAILLSSYL